MQEIDSSSDEAARWARATYRAQGIADRGIGRALTRYFTLYFPASILILLAAGVVIAPLAFDRAWNDPGNLQLGFLLACLGGLIIGWIYNAKRIRPAAEVGPLNVLKSLESDEQKSLRRQILRKIPPVEAHLEVSRAAAVQLRRSTATSLLMLPVLLFCVTANLFAVTGGLWWLVASAVPIGLLAAAQSVREFRLMGQFLRETEDCVLVR